MSLMMLIFVAFVVLPLISHVVEVLRPIPKGKLGPKPKHDDYGW